MEKLTLEEIGKLAGVSRATVSRVVNGYPHIRPEVRERVEKVIRQTGFQPNAVARSLASSQTHIIGLFIPYITQFILGDPYLTALIPGISQASNAQEYTLALFLFNSEEEEEAHFNRILGSSMVDGLIITADRSAGSLVSQLLRRGMPFVMIGRPEQWGDKINFVDVDNHGGTYLGVQHLIQLGYQRIALISTKANTAGDDRTAGYHQALADHGVPSKPELIAMGDFTEGSGYSAMQGLMPQQPDAVFVASDMMALGALRALREAGLDVPRDVAMASFDDLPAAITVRPALTTIRQPIPGAGRLAVETLLDVIEKGIEPPRHIILPTELIVRDSCGADRLSGSAF